MSICDIHMTSLISCLCPAIALLARGTRNLLYRKHSLQHHYLHPLNALPTSTILQDLYPLVSFLPKHPLTRDPTDKDALDFSEALPLWADHSNHGSLARHRTRDGEKVSGSKSSVDKLNRAKTFDPEKVRCYRSLSLSVFNWFNLLLMFLRRYRISLPSTCTLVLLGILPKLVSLIIFPYSCRLR